MNRYRHEYKYLLDYSQKSILLIRASGILEKDPHVINDRYLIRSLYFDDYNDTCLFESESGLGCKSKFRIRYYNDDSSRIQLEKKSKIRGMALKESCLLSIEECYTFINGMVPPISSEMPEDKKKLIVEMQFRKLIPKIVVSYERIPYIYTAGNVRITFDQNITSSSDVINFLDGNKIRAERPILSSGYSVLEVKWDEILPRHLREAMQLERLSWMTFSKYYMCRKYHL